ncbi:hypothetical protein [Nonomuraea recticatena]|uniref:Uncharacterized protein n=1 Tax=Nonomuraea recticatena TaxID=46178 RepID=A0ABP6EHC0_9ACTN
MTGYKVKRPALINAGDVIEIGQAGDDPILATVESAWIRHRKVNPRTLKHQIVEIALKLKDHHWKLQLSNTNDWVRVYKEVDPFAGADRDGVVRYATQLGLSLKPEDITEDGDSFTIDGMPAVEWIEAMTMD